MRVGELTKYIRNFRMRKVMMSRVNDVACVSHTGFCKNQGRKRYPEEVTELARRSRVPLYDKREVQAMWKPAVETSSRDSESLGGIARSRISVWRLF